MDFVLPPEARDGPDFRKRLEWLMMLRLVVTTFLLAATVFFQLQETRSFFVDAAIPLYILIGTIFLLSLIYALSLPRIPDLAGFSLFQVMVDVVYSTVLVYFTGGAASVFSLLYVYPIIASGILHLRRGALLTALAASILFSMLMGLQFHAIIPQSEWPWVFVQQQYTFSYMLWNLVVHVTIFFFVAVLSSSVSEQLRNTRISLNLRELDYWRLSDLQTSIVRSIPSGIITTDEKDTVTYINNSGAKLLGSSPSDLLYSSIKTIFPVIEDGLGRSSIRSQTYLTSKEIGGEQRHVELTVSDLKDRNEMPRGRLVVFQDVTGMKKMEERVKLSEKQAAFVRIAAGMAHEIRNPLASLRGAAELLSLSSSGSNNQEKLLGIVIRESDRLNSLLSDFLIMVSSRPPRRIRVMLSELVEETVALFAGDPRLGRGVTVERLINKSVEVEGEPARLKQALWNLLANAADASHDGGVIRVSLEADQESGQAVLKVQDSGSGILPEVRGRIFEPFTSTKESGTGLGLSLVLSIVEAHGGTIEAGNAPGSGAVFVVRLPLASLGALSGIEGRNDG